MHDFLSHDVSHGHFSAIYFKISPPEDISCLDELIITGNFLRCWPAYYEVINSLFCGEIGQVPLCYFLIVTMLSAHHLQAMTLE